MLKFLMSIAAVFGGLWAWGVAAEADLLRSQERGVLWLASVLVAWPVACAWGVAEVVEKRRPRRALDPRARKPWTLVFAGLAAGLLSVVIATPLIALVDWMSDGVAMGAASVVGTLVAVLALGRKQQGECVHCGYDLSAAADARCTECGAMYSG